MNDTHRGEGISSPMNVTHEQLASFAELIGLTRAAPRRCSTVLILELYCRVFFGFPAPGNPAKVVVEVSALESLSNRPTGTREAEPFKRPPLLGLWKKHYLGEGIAPMAKNMILATGKKQKGLRSIIKRHWNPATAHLPPQTISRNIADEIVGLYRKRSAASELTGEWLIFARHEGQNYYLCLARHDDGDSQILDRIVKGCVPEFPFLGPQLGLTTQSIKTPSA